MDLLIALGKAFTQVCFIIGLAVRFVINGIDL